MGSKDRILRQKEETRNSILVASYKIVKEEGWEGLNMRKIADHIEYTAPTIYEYFPNKQAILEELTRKGFHCLSDKVKKAKLTQTDPAVQLEVMWIAFWNFAFKNKELYQIMFGVEMKCYTQYSIPDTETTCQLFLNTIAAVMETQRPTAADIQLKYFMFFSVIHGLISVNMIGNRLTVATNYLIFKDAVSAIIKSLHKQEILSLRPISMKINPYSHIDLTLLNFVTAVDVDRGTTDSANAFKYHSLYRAIKLILIYLFFLPFT